MGIVEKAFAVQPGTPSPRRTAYGPRSAGWTLYRIADLADKLGVDMVTLDTALEQTGFNKAVRIREETIRWKERLRKEERALMDEQEQHRAALKATGHRLGTVREQLANVRNLLRIPREADAATRPTEEQ